MEKSKKLSLSAKILISLVLGAITGVLIYYLLPAGQIRDDILIEGVFRFIGQGFMNLLQMLVVPLVFFSLSTGALSMGDTASIGRIGIKTVLFYLFTTACAIALALLFSRLINPGVGMNLQITGKVVDINEAPNFIDTMLDIIPTNPIAALAEGNMLQIILFALLIGVICAKLGEKFETITNILNEGNDLMMEMTSMVMTLAPFGVFALIARTFAQLGFDTFIPMISYMLSVSISLVLQVAVVYMPLFILFTRLNPMKFFKKMLPVFAFSFSSASSGATIPVTLKSMDELGVSRKVSSFTIPLGATVNMDGTAIMQGCAVIFIANAYGISLGMADFATVILTATLASVGTAAVPGVGLITLAMVLNSVGLPVEGIAVIMGIDRILDMARTVINVTGDSVVTSIVAKQNGSLNQEIYNDMSYKADSDEF